MSRTNPTLAGDSASTTEAAVFQSNRHARNNGGVASGITAPGDGDPFKVIRVANASASSSTLRARIPLLHGASYAAIPAGEFREFICVDSSGNAAGDVLYISIASGSATYFFEVTG